MFETLISKILSTSVRLLCGVLGVGFASTLVACSANYPALFDEASDAGAICVLHGRVLVGPDLVALDDADICFQDGTIVSLGPHGTIDKPAQAWDIDVRGNTVLPGLVDTHVHVLVTEAPPWEIRLPDPEHNLEAWLWSGITTVFDMGGTPANIDALQQQVTRHEILGPQIFFTQEPISAPGGHPIPAMKALLPWPFGNLLATTVPVIASIEEAPDIVASAQSRGVQYIKIIHDELPPGAPRMDVPRLVALINATHAVGLKAMVHIGSNQDALEAITAGADHLVHGVYREHIAEAVIEAARERQVTITFTAASFDNTRKMAMGRYHASPNARRLSDPVLVDAVTGEAGAQFADLDVLGEFARGIASTDVLRSNVRRLHEAGVVVLVGTDSPIAGVFPGVSLHEELRFLASAGIPADVLVRRVTVDGARLITNTPGFGTLEVGARADILVVGGDPMRNIEALEDVKFVFADGRPLARIVGD